jgi:aryl-alcohol dehydrogenase-like predicted oxidoreductase
MQTEETLTAERIALGPTAIQISPLGLGTWAWGDRLMWGYGQGRYTDADIAAAYQVSLAHGINFFDTAESYGQGKSETLLGQLRRQASWPVVVATKFMPFPWRLTRSELLQALRSSLRRLDMPAVDLYQMHWPFPPVPIATWMDAMAAAVEAGLVRAVGVSNYNSSQLQRAYDALSRRGIPLASNQVNYSLINRKAETSGLFDLCCQLNVTLIAYSPLGKGLLTGKYTPDNPPPGLRRGLYRRGRLAQIQPLTRLLRESGEERRRSAGQVALNWAICKGAVPIPGAKTARQAMDNAGALGWRLTADEVARLDEVSARVAVQSRRSSS